MSRCILVVRMSGYQGLSCLLTRRDMVDVNDGRLTKRLMSGRRFARLLSPSRSVTMRNGCRGPALFRGLLALLTLSTSACGVTQNYPYPESWSPVPGGAPKGCQDLNGVYADLGEPRKFTGINPSLSFNLGWQSWGGIEDRKQGW